MSMENQVDDLLTAMVELVSAWSSTPVQAQIAQRIGLTINESDIRLLHTIGRLGEVRPAQLAAALHVTRPTMSKGLDRLGAAGLIERIVAPDDRRASIITLSASGHEAYSRLVAVGIDMVQQALAEAPEMQTQTDAFIHFARALRATT